ncbi:MAG: right-handed parallel beta-helix repeat-containing protein, partial [Methanomassiliicoccales archaeon]
MAKKVLHLGLGVFLFANALFAAMLMSGFTGEVQGETLFVGGSGGDNYTCIRHALENASAGASIVVFSGTYQENLTITQSVILVGENEGTTIIDGLGASNVVYIDDAFFVGLAQFTIKNGSRGVYISDSEGVVIKSVKITDCDDKGVYVANSNGIKISESELSGSGSGSGIEASYTTSFTSENNSVEEFTYGIYLDHANEAEIHGNYLHDNSARGLAISWSTDITVTSTTIDGSDYGVYFFDFSTGTIYNSIITNSGFADILMGMDRLTLVNTSFDYGSVVISTADALLIVKNYLEVRVEGSGGTPVSGADVLVKEGTTEIYNSTSGDPKTDG